jgi:alginate O-acetyltransferase complex protein AlgI
LFLPVVLAGYHLLVPRRARNAWLLCASYVFYGWWDWRFCGLLLLTTSIDYFAGQSIVSAPSRAAARRALALSIAADLSLLGFFKYCGFGAETLNAIASALGVSHPLVPVLSVTLPVGMSFYTFQAMSYSIDLYRREARPARSFLDFACYVSLFPQLVAGPIVRYRDLDAQLRERESSWAAAGAGAALFVLGLAKKVLVADAVAPIADFAFSRVDIGFAGAWTGLAAYTMQIYFDFSGYSDMAVGLGLLFGFRFPANFLSPYKSRSMTEFWTRWHVSLSTWLRDYLYIPLGGNRKGAARTYANLFLTMLLGGLWHGASWTFVAWGAWHGFLLAAERMLGKRSFFVACPAPVQMAGTFLLAMLGWLLFRSPDLAVLGSMLRGLSGLNGPGPLFPAHNAAWPHWAGLAVAFLLAFAAPNTWEMRWKPSWRTAGALAALFLLCVAVILVNTSSPFLYFQF